LPKSKVPPQLALAIAKAGERVADLIQRFGFHGRSSLMLTQPNYTPRPQVNWADAGSGSRSRYDVVAAAALPWAQGERRRLGATIMPTLFVNRERVDVASSVPGDTPLLWILRDYLSMTGTKYGCGMALCGACTVHIDGSPIRSCSTPLSSIKPGVEITTIEGLKTKESVAVQAAWEKLDVAQCGYCQSGQVLAATALLAKNKRPTDADIDQAMAGNLCRCATYARIRSAIKDASKALG